MAHEYKVVAAPTKGLKAKGIKSSADRFAHMMETGLNEMAAEGWEYVRSDTLPSEEREGLMSKTTVFQNVLIFRREIAVIEEPTIPTPAPIPQEPEVKAEPVKEEIVEVDKTETQAEAPEDDAPKSS